MAKLQNNSSVEDDPDGLQILWEKEFEEKAVMGHRIFCFAFLIGYPLSSILYYLNGNPHYRSILVVQLIASALVSVSLYLHFRGRINGQDTSFISRMIMVICHSFVLAAFKTLYYYDLNINLTLQLIFSVLVLRWKLSYSVISAATTIVFFSAALYFNASEVFIRFVKEGGMIYFLGQAFFPLILQMRYSRQHREFLFFHQLQKQNQELERQNKAVREATQAKSDFLSTMSHEIRTPLNGIVGMIHLMLQEDLRTPFQKELVQTMKFSADHLMAVVNNILDFNKINSNHVKLSQEPFDLAMLLRNLEKTFIPRAAEKKLDLIFEVEPGLPSQLIGDLVRLSQIITNLIHNAVKFTDEGFVKLVVREEKRDFEHVTLYFEVRDSGVGIPPADQPTIFEIFTQSQNEARQSTRGTGLGLAITKELLRLFGSEIKLESELDKGSTFSFKIDFEYSDIPVEAAKPPAIKVTLPEVRILVVDDYPINLMLVTNLLKKVGLQYDTAENGQEAVEKFNAMHYDLVLMDLKMPVMDGFEATSIMRAQGAKQPVIALTASAFTDEREKALSNGFSAYLVKPFLPDDLYDLIFMFLKPEEVRS